MLKAITETGECSNTTQRLNSLVFKSTLPFNGFAAFAVDDPLKIYAYCWPSLDSTVLGVSFSENLVIQEAAILTDPSSHDCSRRTDRQHCL